MIQRAPGYSGTPLAKKLGIKQGTRLLLIAAPKNYSDLLAPLPPSVKFVTRPNKTIDIAHVFTTRRALLAKHLRQLRKSLDVHASIWVSWPKKAARIPTDITEQTIRDVALPLGFVDIKVCAVDEVWSGLKLVVRKDLRASSDPQLQHPRRMMDNPQSKNGRSP